MDISAGRVSADRAGRRPYTFDNNAAAVSNYYDAGAAM